MPAGLLRGALTVTARAGAIGAAGGTDGAGGAGDEPRSAASVAVSADEPVFAGHYPGFPILPGVCVIEFVHRTALASAPAGDGELRLDAVDSARFLGAVLPGTTMHADLAWSRRDERLRCRAEVRTDDGPVAVMALRFGTGGAA